MRARLVTLGLLVVVVVGCGRPPVSAPTTEGDALVVRTATLERGPLAHTISLVGTLQPLRRVELAAELPARVVRVPVKEGERVAAGALLAQLDDRDLRAQVAKAQAGVAAAQAQVRKARLGREVSAELAAARVARAEAGRRSAQAAHDQAQAGAGLSARHAEADVARAAAGVAAATSAVAQAETGAALARQQAQAEVEAAQAGVSAAEADVRRATTGAQVGDEASAAEIERARAGLTAAEANLARVKAGARPAEVEAAHAQVEQARAGRDHARKTVDDLEFLHKQGGLAGADLEGARTQLKVAQAQFDAAEAQWRNARAGATSQEIAAAGAQVAEAKAGLAQAQAGGGRAKVAAAEIEAARAALSRAQAGLRAARQVKADRVAVADEQVRAARAALDQAKAGLKAAEVGRGQSDVRRAETAAAQGNVAAADAGLSEAAVGRREAEVLGADLAAAQAGLVAAQADCRLAAQQLGKTLVTSPVAGTVSKLAVQAGSTLMPGMPLAVVETAAAAEMLALATGPERAQLRPGQRARLRIEGVAGECGGVVTNIAGVAEADGRSFKVRLLVSGLHLPPGAQARAEVEVASERAALAAPLAAVCDLDGAQPYVFVVRDGRARRQSVVLGLRAAERVQILAGPRPGEQVVLDGADGVHDGARVEVPTDEAQAAVRPQTGPAGR